MINEATLVGRLGRDVELRHTNSGTAVADIRIATDRWSKQADGSSGNVTDWHNVTLWGRTAEAASQYLRKGSLVYVSGYIETQQWEKDGEKRYTTRIVARVLKYLQGYSGDNQGAGGNVGPSQTTGGSIPSDDIPF